MGHFLKGFREITDLVAAGKVLPGNVFPEFAGGYIFRPRNRKDHRFCNGTGNGHRENDSDNDRNNRNNHDEHHRGAHHRVHLFGHYRIEPVCRFDRIATGFGSRHLRITLLFLKIKVR